MRSTLLLSSLMAISLFGFGCSKGEEQADDLGASVEAGDEQDLNAAAKSNAAPIGRAAHAKLRDLAGKVTLGMMGEDSGSLCSAAFRIGPASELTDREVLRLFQFNVDAQLANDELQFRAQSKTDADFWQSFEDSQFDEEGVAAAKEVKALLTSDDVTGLAIMIPADRVPFGASVFLVARMKDGSLLALRGEIGGMAF